MTPFLPELSLFCIQYYTFAVMGPGNPCVMSFSMTEKLFVFFFSVRSLKWEILLIKFT